MSAAKKMSGTKTASPKAVQQPVANTITLPTLSALLAPTLATGVNVDRQNAPCNECCRTSTTVCLTFDTTWLQLLVNMFPKIQITNNNTCVDNDCDDEDETGK